MVSPLDLEWSLPLVQEGVASGDKEIDLSSSTMVRAFERGQLL